MKDEGEEIRSYPLAWPIGRPRSKHRHAAPFRHRGGLVPIDVAASRLLTELRRFNATSVVISTNVKPTLTGIPSRESPAGKDPDPGAAVYFRLEGRPHAMSCDRWLRVADNVAALAAHIEAIRGQLRWGCADVGQVFAGFRALPAMGAPKAWWEVLGLKSPQGLSPELLERRRDELARRHHPDLGGNANQMAEINAAYDEGRRQLEAHR